MYVKICGTTNLQDARLSVELGADALGFIFAPSQRRVSIEQVAAITRELPSAILRVGVFTEPEVDTVAAAVRAAGLTAVQMHWSYTTGTVAALRRKLGADVTLWQVVGFEVSPADREEADRNFTRQLRASLADPAVDVVLLDAVKGARSGGMGKTFAWKSAARLVASAKQAAGRKLGGTPEPLPKVVVAGGLTPGNLREAVTELEPWGVDVVSGVERSPGHKDPDRLKQFLQEAKAAQG